MISVLPGEKFMFSLNLDPLLPRMSESGQTSTALCVGGLQRFSCVSFIERAVTISLSEGDLCYVYIYRYSSLAYKALLSCPN